jgi:hypothetical protein
LYRSDERLDASLAKIKALGFTRLRVTATWSGITRNASSKQRPAFDASDPAAYEQEKWRPTDRVILAAQKHGIPIMLDIAFWAPYWATSDPEGSLGIFARNNINMEEYRPPSPAAAPPASAPAAGFNSFSGVFGGDQTNPNDPKPPSEDSGDDQANPEDPKPLPKVSLYSIWNEPNIPTFFGPQWRAGSKGQRVPASPHTYRRMVSITYPAIKRLNPDATVLIGGLACCGSYRVKGFNGGIPPLLFLREMACVNRRLQPLRRDGCKNFTTIQGDGWTHHPYSFERTPETPHPKSTPDHVYMGDLEELDRLLRRLVKMGRMSKKVANLYITEFGYFTPPTLQEKTVNYQRQALLALWSHYVAWKLPSVRMHAQFLLHDLACEKVNNPECNNWPTGIFSPGTEKTGGEGSAKPLAQALEAGVFAYRTPKRKLVVWARVAGRAADRPLRLEGKVAGRWRVVKPRRAVPDPAGRPNGIFTTRIKLPGIRRMRIAWQAADGQWVPGFDTEVVSYRRLQGRADGPLAR